VKNETSTVCRNAVRGSALRRNQRAEWLGIDDTADADRSRWIDQFGFARISLARPRDDAHGLSPVRLRVVVVDDRHERDGGQERQLNERR
jgi:hypothetical protein